MMINVRKAIEQIVKKEYHTISKFIDANLVGLDSGNVEMKNKCYRVQDAAMNPGTKQGAGKGRGASCTPS